MADRQPLIQILRTPPPVPEGLRRFAEARASRTRATEVCELCGAGMDTDHGHLVNVRQRSLLCVCRPCYLLFTHEGAGGARFRAVPQRYVALEAFAGARASWDALQLPIGLAFFFKNSLTGKTTAFYPSPAGATESELTLDAWEALSAAVPALQTLAADVEALIVRRIEGRVDAFIAPIDACYELVGRIRRAWQGMQGGDEVWREIDEFFERATERARGTALV